MIRFRQFPALLFLIAAVAARAHADVVQCGPGIPPQVICLTGNVSDTAGGGPLVAGRVYHLAGFVGVPVGETLTVEDGAILKFHLNSRLEVRGRLNAGNATLTSIADDAAGGDTNGDNPEQIPALGDWDGVIVFATTTMNQTTIRFAITGVVLFHPGGNPQSTLQGVTIGSCSGPALDAGLARPTVTNCTFRDSQIAVGRVRLDALPGFTGNSASGNTLGDCIYVTDAAITSNTTIGQQNSLDGRPIVVCPLVTVFPGSTLDLQPGLVVKFGTIPPFFQGCGLGGILVEGTLNTAGVIFTSLADDSLGGDTPKDGFTTGAPGDWGAIEFTAGSGASLLQQTLMRFGGAFTLPPFVRPAITLGLSVDVTLDGVTVAECASTGLSLATSASPTVTNCAFQSNQGVAVVGVNAHAVAGFTSNSAQGNAGDYIQLSVQGSVDGAMILRDNSLNEDGVFVYANNIQVPTGQTLVIGEGVVMKKQGGPGGFFVSGTLTADGSPSAPVVFTTFTDDEIAGDTNEDGKATQPAPGEWNGLGFFPGSDASVLDRVLVRYAGDATLTTAAVRLSASSPTITFTTIELSETACLGMTAACFPQVSGCTFRDSEEAVTGVAIRAVPGFTGNSASGNARGNYLSIANGDVSFGFPGPLPGGSLVIGPASTLNGDSAFVFTDDIEVPVGFQLGILPDTIVKFDGPRTFDVDGTVALGGLGGPVVLTSLDDDSIGGDTQNDGSTDGAPGDWRQVHISANGSYLENVVVRYAGNGGNDALRIVGATTQVEDVMIQDCAGAALGIPSSTPLVGGCQFDRNLRAVNEASIRALPGFSNNSASDNTFGDYIRITDGNVTSNLLVQTANSLNGMPFVFATNVNVLAGATLTLAPGVVCKFDGNRALSVSGTLSTSAAPGSIVFTTLLDDIAGDTNKDMGASVPVPGSWSGLQFQATSDASVLAGGRVRYASSTGSAAIFLSSADVQILDTFVEFSGGEGLRASVSNPQVRRCSFTDGLGLPVNFASIGALPGFTDNTAGGNAPGDYIRVSSPSFTGHVTIARNNSLNSNGVFVVDTSVGVNSSQTLELRQGTVFKWQGNRSLTVGSGTLILEGTGFEPVIFTSVHDDAVVGDTQKNGSTVLPAPGNWGALAVNNGSGPSTIESFVARYGGSSLAAVQLSSLLCSARSLRAERSASDGIRAANHPGDAVNWIAFQNMGDGIELTGGMFDVLHATAASNGSAGLRKAAAHMGALFNSISFANTGGELAGFQASNVFFSDAGPAFDGINGSIHADPGFTDLAGGDLTLGPSSACIDTASFNVSSTLPKDHREASRILDHDLDGTALSDMGAFERAAYELEYGGEPKVGSVMSFTVHGSSPGIAIFRLGLLGGETFVDPFGFTLYGAPSSGIVIGSAPVGETILLPVPHATTQVGMSFGVQALVRPFGGQLPAHGRASAFAREHRARARGDEPLAVTGSGPLAGAAFAPQRPGLVPGNLSNLYRGRVLP